MSNAAAEVGLPCICQCPRCGRVYRYISEWLDLSIVGHAWPGPGSLESELRFCSCGAILPLEFVTVQAINSEPVPGD